MIFASTLVGRTESEGCVGGSCEQPQWTMWGGFSRGSFKCSSGHTRTYAKTNQQFSEDLLNESIRDQHGSSRLSAVIYHARAEMKKGGSFFCLWLQRLRFSLVFFLVRLFGSVFSAHSAKIWSPLFTATEHHWSAQLNARHFVCSVLVSREANFGNQEVRLAWWP